MKKIKIAMFTFLTVCMLSLCVMPTSAAEFENPVNPPNPTIEPRWWPGNPNPPMYSEAWFQQNLGYGSGASSAVARKCAGEALSVSVTSTTISAWISKGTFSVGSFSTTFGIGYVYSYGACLVRNS